MAGVTSKLLSSCCPQALCRAAFSGSSRTFRLNLFTGSIHEIDSSITQLQHDLSIFPRSDPRRLKPMFSLAIEQGLRYALSKQREDLNKAIVHFTESILLSPLSRLQRGQITLGSLFLLASALLSRSKVSKRPEDAICATKYLSYLRDQPHEIPMTPRYRFTEFLVEALALQVELEAGNAMQNIREMVVLSRELLETSDADATQLILLIHSVVESKIRLAVPDKPLDEIIEFSRVARRRRPDLLDAHMIFAMSLVYRYYMTCVNDDYEEAASILDDIIAYRSPGNSQDQYVANARAKATALVTVLATIRSLVCQTPENLEEAIYRTRTCASSSSVKEHFPSLASMVPELTAKKRFQHFGSIDGVEESSGNLLANVFPQEYTQTIGGMKDLLFQIHNTDDTTEIDEAIERGRSILVTLDSSPIPRHPFSIYLATSSTKHSTALAQRRSSTLTSRLAYAVKRSSHRFYRSNAS